MIQTIDDFEAYVLSRDFIANSEWLTTNRYHGCLLYVHYDNHTKLRNDTERLFEGEILSIDEMNVQILPASSERVPVKRAWQLCAEKGRRFSDIAFVLGLVYTHPVIRASELHSVVFRSDLMTYNKFLDMMEDSLKLARGDLNPHSFQWSGYDEQVHAEYREIFPDLDVNFFDIDHYEQLISLRSEAWSAFRNKWSSKIAEPLKPTRIRKGIHDHSYRNSVTVSRFSWVCLEICRLKETYYQ